MHLKDLATAVKTEALVPVLDRAGEVTCVKAGDAVWLPKAFARPAPDHRAR